MGTAYLELATLADTSVSRAAIQAAIGNYVLAAIAFADAICLTVLGRRSADSDHHRAAELLAIADRDAAGDLRRPLTFKTQAHYGPVTMSGDDLIRVGRITQRMAERARREIG